jgi:hypothetical protein
MIKEVTLEEFDDDFICSCGNDVMGDGFHTCDPNGNEAEPIAGIWQGHYKCGSCNLIYHVKGIV